MKKLLPTLTAAALAVSTLSLTSCETPVGAGIAYGAGTGAIIGGLTGSGQNAALNATPPSRNRGAGATVFIARSASTSS